MARRAAKPADPIEDEDEPFEIVGKPGAVSSFAARLIRQGTHRFYTLTLPSEILVETCFVDRREENPEEGFQRVLDRKRAQDIADYIDVGLGTIPGSIVLSAQPEAVLEYNGKNQVLSFKKIRRAFMILDGQHRVYGFSLAKASVRVPVVIYNNLSKSQEAQIFIDINTKQRSVPNELLLDIKRLAESEKDFEALLREVFDLFDKDINSPLLGLMSPAARVKGKISRVTFQKALRPIWSSFSGSDPELVYQALSSYLHAFLAGLRAAQAEKNIANPTLLRATMLLFPSVAERVSDRHGANYTVQNFNEILEPFFARVKRNDLRTPGARPSSLYSNFKNALQSGFTIGRR